MNMVRMLLNGKYELSIPDHRAARPQWLPENGGWEAARTDAMAERIDEDDTVFYVGAEEGEFPRFIGLINLHPQGLGDEARIGRQAEQVVKVEQEAVSRRAATERDLFPILAECGMRPDDLVPETAARYAEYLKERVPE